MKMMRLRLARTAVAFVCGAMALAAEANAWVVGQVAPMSGAGATQGRAYAQGMRLYFDQINKAGGVQGQPVQLVTVDQADMDAFVTIYKDHIKAEEEQVYPQAKQALSLDQLVVMSRDMVGRRGR